MSRPWIHWLLFTLCLAVFTGAVLSITRRALAMDEQRRQAAEEAQVQEKIRLALWRMEAVAGALMIRENARPPHHYQSFYQPEDLIVNAGAPLPPGRALLPSPLFDNLPDLVRLHFEKAGDGAVVCSPQVPAGAQKEVAAAWYVTSPQTALAAERLAELQALLQRHPDLQTSLSAAPPPPAMLESKAADEQWKASNRELVQRSQVVQQNIQTEKLANAPPQALRRADPFAGKDAAEADRDRINVTRQLAQAGDMRAMWAGAELLLLRQASANGQTRLQGVWLDWPLLQARLIEAARDLLPNMTLEPLPDVERDDWMALVSLPVRLVPGVVPVEGVANHSVLKPALLLAWGCLLAAAVAIALVLHRAMQLSARRAAFVSAVTHELRTPLTTFQLYSEMLADDIVAEPARRKDYLRTLCEESTRLTHLVENVLSFSRIERGRAAVRLEDIAVAALLERVTPRLHERCAQAGLELSVDADDNARAAALRVDPMTLEQVLFNLTDNACKYAAPDSDPKELLLSARRDGRSLVIAVRDHGPGLSAEARRKLFQPFSKSASEAAHSAPGVGLGLALCRRLARELGGSLTHHPPAGRGAEFRLRLPVAPGDAA